ncbi:armadillo-type fold protein, partial [Tanacetum coccineum]
ACARLRKYLGQYFLPYMNVFMPPQLHSAQLKPDVTFTSVDSDADIDENLMMRHVQDFANMMKSDESIETIQLGDKRIGIKTSVLEEKATACNMLCYADELKEGFFPGLIRLIIRFQLKKHEDSSTFPDAFLQIAFCIGLNRPCYTT